MGSKSGAEEETDGIVRDKEADKSNSLDPDNAASPILLRLDSGDLSESTAETGLVEDGDIDNGRTSDSPLPPPLLCPTIVALPTDDVPPPA